MRTTAGVKVPLSWLLATGAEVGIFLSAGTLRVGGAFGLLSGCKVISFPCSKSLTCFSRDSISSAIAAACANCLDVRCSSFLYVMYFTARFRSYSKHGYGGCFLQILLSEQKMKNGNVATLQSPRGRLARCSSRHLLSLWSI